MDLPPVITIDGPAGSGKTTIGRMLAERLGYLFVDTGVMYRAVTWAALDSKLPVEDEGAVTTLAERIEIDIRPPSRPDGRDFEILADGRDITWQTRNSEVEENVSLVSSYPGVRKALTAQQRRLGLRGSVVMAGRDIGTVVIPEAPVKFYLNASLEERARRRFMELQNRGECIDLESIKSAMLARDRFDSSRKHAPLRPAEDAVVLDTDGLNIQEVLDKIIMVIEKSLPEDGSQ
ncbi:MAG: cytidylate kinase [Chloroflexi bacterium RBG_16_54_18]|nr:MAG: cytidylate kinase [Chloroflexi bacterium RBG_16_54_18]